LTFYYKDDIFKKNILNQLNKKKMVTKIQFSHCIFLIESGVSLTVEIVEQLTWILNPAITGQSEQVVQPVPGMTLSYLGPNLHFETPDSAKLRAICNSIGILGISRIEKFDMVLHEPGVIPDHDKMTQTIYSVLPKTLINENQPKPTKTFHLSKGGVVLFQELNVLMGLGMDQFDLEYYYNIFIHNYKRNPTETELMQLAQANSSHSRHWEFSGKFIIDGQEMSKTLFEMVKNTLQNNPGGSIKAFKDNGGILRGGEVSMFIPGPDGVYYSVLMNMHHTATAETHNHPSLISPYAGAATGVGGRMRDISAIGRGSLIGFGGVYFQTGKLYFNEQPVWNYPPNMATPIEILRGAILGASGWGNPFGEPTLLFGNDSLGIVLPNGDRFETVKPNIYTCAVGMIPADTPDKAIPEPGMIIVRIGGPTYRIGVGGGAASSMDAGSNAIELDFKSVQRGEPMMGRSAYNVIEHCVLMGPNNPIESIHDQGAGGASNVLTELTEPCGGWVDLAKINIADHSLSQTETWVAESQELYGLLIKPENLPILQNICEKYNCPIEILGQTNNSQKIVVKDSRDKSTPVDLSLPEILGKLPQKTYVDETKFIGFSEASVPNLSTSQHLKNVAAIPGVALLGYMVDHFDGSVGGRVVQGPRVGVHQLPICRYGIISSGFKGITGTLNTYTRSNPIAMLINEQATARMLVAEALMNLSLVHIPGGTSRIKGRLNVMWSFKKPGMKAKLYSAYTAVTDTLTQVGIGIDGGKDSLSMMTSFNGESATSFPTFIIEKYAHVADVRTRVTPDLKADVDSDILLIKLNGNSRMGGSALYEAYDQTGNEVPDVDVHEAKKLFKLMQYLVRKKKLLAASPNQKGGILATLTKMALSSDLDLMTIPDSKIDNTDIYFNEEPGMIIQCKNSDTSFVSNLASVYGLRVHDIGFIKNNRLGLFGYYRAHDTIECTTQKLFSWFNATSSEIKKTLGIPATLTNSEVRLMQNYKLSFNPDETISAVKEKVFKVAVLCAPGTNGHHELAWMFGRNKRKFIAQCIQMNELINGQYDLKDFNVLAFAGGFSYGDVGGSGKGWAASILFNPRLLEMFRKFKTRPDTLSFGTCNGFQVATLLGILDESLEQSPRLVHNNSGIFEHRSVNLLIPENTKSIMFKGMGGSILPAWAAHGEGKLYLPEINYYDLEKAGLVCVSYADSDGYPTEQYPYNPNGTINGVAGLCTNDGRHTFMMPHIERYASNCQLPYQSKDWKFKNSIWGKSIDNIYQWLVENTK
jgi:phosphoribosylformylglycinamidine synthase